MKLRIGKFQARDLYNTGNLLDKQDPCLKISIGHNEYITERKQDAGTNADFTECYEIDISREEYQSGVSVIHYYYLINIVFLNQLHFKD